MQIDLVIPTIGRVEPLRRLLESLRTQVYKNFRILLADQNPSWVLDTLLNEYSCDLSIQRMLLSQCGASAARNALLPLVSGDIVAFPDDDCFYQPDTLEGVRRFFQTHSEYGAVLGVWHPSAHAGKLPAPCLAPLRQENRFSIFKGAGTLVQFFRRDAVMAAGSFDEQLGPGSGLPYGCGEDTDFLLRVINAGYSVGRTPQIRVYHDSVDPNLAGMAVKAYAYGRGRTYLLKKHAFPAWFIAGNIIYPLWRMLIEGPQSYRYRWQMLRGRIEELFR